MLTPAELQMLRNADPGVVLPGIDTPTGNPLVASSLRSPASFPSSGAIIYNPSTNVVIVHQNGAVISGINFGTAGLIIAANNVTVEDCTFGLTSNSDGGCGIFQWAGYSGATVENCTFTGTGGVVETNNGEAPIVSKENITIKNNSFLDTPSDAIDIQGGTVTGNYFSGAGFLTGAHADAIWVTNTTGLTTITNNFIDYTQDPGASTTNDAIRITTEVGSVSNVQVSGNYLIGGGYTVSAGAVGTRGTFSNVSVTGNYIGFDLFGAFYPGWGAGTTISGNTIFDFTNPTYSSQAWAAYQAAGVPTRNLIAYNPSGPATVDGVIGGAVSPGSTTIYGDSLNAATLSGSPQYETNLIGGAGKQHIWGGAGANVFTYLSISDSNVSATDQLSNFDPAKDVIDLSHIDANLVTSGVQSFTFIGTAPFSSSGGQVRYQFDPTKDVTYVEADLVGDSSPDLEFYIDGDQTLTAANFALTAAQSASDLAKGANLSVTSVRDGSGSIFSYANVSGEPYSSFKAYYTNNTSRVADDLYLTSSADDLVLCGNGMTIQRAGGAETMTAGSLSFALGYHATQTIDATAAGGETFKFGSNFGNETIQNFITSGTVDTLQLAVSSFSYLSPSMSQAQDLAAVLAHSVSSSSGTTISDTTGDSVTLVGLSRSTITAAASQFHFG